MQRIHIYIYFLHFFSPFWPNWKSYAFIFMIGGIYLTGWVTLTNPRIILFIFATTYSTLTIMIPARCILCMHCVAWVYYWCSGPIVCLCVMGGMRCIVSHSTVFETYEGLSLFEIDVCWGVCEERRMPQLSFDK